MIKRLRSAGSVSGAADSSRVGGGSALLPRHPAATRPGGLTRPLLLSPPADCREAKLPDLAEPRLPRQRGQFPGVRGPPASLSAAQLWTGPTWNELE